MLSVSKRCSVLFVAAVIASCRPISFAHAQQRLPGIFSIFGGMMNSAIADQTRRQWRNLPFADYNCLETHNMSADELAAIGIGPKDPRVQEVLAQCAAEAADAAKVTVSPTIAPTSRTNPKFVVEGLAVGSPVNPDSPTYKAYKCEPSEEFPSFKWCRIHRTMTAKSGPYDSSVHILHSDADTAVFIFQEIAPAYFAPGDAEREIQRLSQQFGQPTLVLNGEPRRDARHSVIAAWGDVTLTPLDESTMDELRRGQSITAGLLVDFLDDFRGSAREGMPVFHMGGGAGFIWAAKFDDNGVGRLRIAAVNPSLLPGGAPERVPSSASSYASTAAPAPVARDPAQTEKDRAARATVAIAAAQTQLCWFPLRFDPGFPLRTDPA